MSTTVNMHEAKTHFSRLAERAASGEDIVIARSGVPYVRLTMLKPPRKQSWLGCLADQDFAIPDDFDTMGQAEIEEMFYGNLDAEKNKP